MERDKKSLEGFKPIMKEREGEKRLCNKIQEKMGRTNNLFLSATEVCQVKNVTHHIYSIH